MYDVTSMLWLLVAAMSPLFISSNVDLALFLYRTGSPAGSPAPASWQSCPSMAMASGLF